MKRGLKLTPVAIMANRMKPLARFVPSNCRTVVQRGRGMRRPLTFTQESSHE